MEEKNAINTEPTPHRASPDENFPEDTAQEAAIACEPGPEESLSERMPAEDEQAEGVILPEECERSGGELPPEESYTPKDRYEAALLRVYKDETLSEMLRISSVVIVLLTAYAFLSRLVLLFGDGKYVELIELLCITAVPFVIVSIVRKLIDAPRPYEQLPFYRTPPKNKKGSSFPSRHVFSVFVIAAALAPYAPWLSVLLLALGAALGAFRVLLGIHYVRDVVAGALIGAVSGALGHLVFFLF